MPKELSKKKLIIIGCLALLIAVLVSIFIIRTDKQRTSVVLPINDDLEQQDENPGVFDMTAQQIQNAQLELAYVPFSENEFIYTAHDASIQLKDGVRDVVFCSIEQSVGKVTYFYAYEEHCNKDGTELGRGSVALSHVVINDSLEPPRFPAILTITKDGEKISFLVGLGKSASGGVFEETSQRLPSSLQIKNVSLSPSGLVSITQTNRDEILYFQASFHEALGIRFQQLTSDFQHYVFNILDTGLSFSYPKKFSGGYKYSFYQTQGRSYSAETKHNKHPIYFGEACAAQPRFADITYRPAITDVPEGQDFEAELSFHHVAQSSVFLTTSYYGYDPLEWDTITDTVSILEYINEIQSGAEIPNRTVSKIQIGDQVIRHIAPYTTGRECNFERYEQYQWVQEGLLVNLIVQHPEDRLYNSSLTQELLVQVIRSIGPVGGE